MKLRILFFYLFSIFFCIAQNQAALKLYNQGVEHYNNQEYEKANALFSESISLDKNKDTYFARALCLGKMANKKGYCENLENARVNGEEKATKLFLKFRGKIDSMCKKLEQDFTKMDC